MRRTGAVWLIAGILAAGCVTKTPPVEGSFKSQNAALVLSGGKFEMSLDGVRVEGETSQLLGDRLTLHPKTLEGRTEDEATQDAFKRAAQMGVQTDMEALASYFQPIRMKVGQGGKTLVPEGIKPLTGGRPAPYQAIGELRR